MILKDTNIGRLILEHSSSVIKTAELKNNNKPDIKDAKKISNGLAKIASIPYSEKSYASVQAIMKIASECIGELVNSLESTKLKASEFEKAAEVRILLDDMINSGSVDEFNIHEKIAELMKKNERQLDIIKEATKMIKGGKSENIFFEIEKDAATSSIKKEMFSGVID